MVLQVVFVLDSGLFYCGVAHSCNVCGVLAAIGMWSCPGELPIQQRVVQESG